MMKLFPELRRPWSDGLTSSLGLEDYRDPYERYFGLFGEDDGGGGGNDSNTAGSTNVDRFNPNEMAARERAAARAGTVTDSKGNPVTSGGGTSVVTAGGATDYERSMAQQKFAAETGNPLSNQARDLAESVAQREQAAAEQQAKERSAVSMALQQAQTQAPSVSAPVTDPITQQPAVRNALAQAENQRIANLTPDEAAAQGVTVAQQRQAQAALTGQTVNPVTGALEGTPTGTIMDAFTGELTSPDQLLDDMATRSAAFRAGLSPDERAQLEAIEARNRAAVFGTTVAPEATAEAVLGPSDVARMATEDAGMVTDMGPYDAQVFGTTSSGLDAGDLMLNPELAGGIGTLPTAAGTVRDLQAQRQGQLQGPPQLLAGSVMPERTYGDTTLGASTTSFLDYPGTVNDVDVYTTIDPVTGRATSAASPFSNQDSVPMDSMSFAQQLNEQRLAEQRASAPAPAAQQLSPLEQSIQDAVAASTRSPVEQIGTTPTAPMGAQAAAGTPAEGFYSDAYRELYSGVEGNIPGTGMASFSNALQEYSPIGAIVRGITGAPPLDLPPAEEQAAFQSGQLLGMPGAEIDPTTGAITGAQAGKGTLNMNRFGMVTYSGMPDPNYTGPFANLINPPPEDTGGADEVTAQQVNPCPEGYQLVDGVCQPVDDVTADAGSQPGSNFVINPTTGLPTLFQPTTQATQVGQINPFVLQPYTPMQAQQIGQARAGIQALSPTGAALGRQV